MFKNDTLPGRQLGIWRWTTAEPNRPSRRCLIGGRIGWECPMRPALVATSALLLFLGTGSAEAADPAQLAETAGFLLGNAHRCGVPTDRVDHAGKVIHHLIVAASCDPTDEAVPIHALPKLSWRAPFPIRTVTY